LRALLSLAKRTLLYSCLTWFNSSKRALTLNRAPQRRSLSMVHSSASSSVRFFYFFYLFFSSSYFSSRIFASHILDDPTIQTDDNFDLSFGFIEWKVVSLNSLAVMAYTTKVLWIFAHSKRKCLVLTW
jgi:hypothetical protein